MSRVPPGPAYHLNAFVAPWLMVGVALLVLAGVVYNRQRASRVGVFFSLMIGLVAVWFGTFSAMFVAVRPETAEMWGRAGLCAICLLPAAVYDFTLTALRLSSARRAVLVAVWTVSIGFAALAAFTTAIVNGVIEHTWGFYPRAGWLVVPCLVFFFGVLTMQVVEALAEIRRSSDPRRRRRISRLLLSFVVVYVAAVDFIPMFAGEMRPIGYLPVLGFIILAWTTIRRHRLPQITAARAAREILDTMADALFVLDAGGRIRVINGAVHALLGRDEGDLLGRSIESLEQPSGRDTITRTMHALPARGAVRERECVLLHKDGSAIDVSVSISQVSDDDVREGAVVIARDIRERKRADAEVHSFMARLESSNRELEDFAYVASHDLQEPLRKIQAFGDLLKKKHAAALPEQGRDYIDRMQAAARRMHHLINDLLSFSRVTTKAQPFIPVDLEHMAHEVAKDLEIRTVEAGARIVIGALPTIDADPTQMRQVLQNLVANALKFRRPETPPLVTIAAEIDGDRCRMTVQDNGIGFDPRYADRIFTMFERLHSRADYEGTGIGLAICRKIAQRHGGEIAASSTPGQGSTFTVTLPAHHDHEREINHA